MVATPRKRKAQKRLPAQAVPLGLGQVLTGDLGYQVTEDGLMDHARESMRGDPHWDELTEQMIMVSPAFFAHEVLTGPPEPPYNGHFLIAEHHEEWDALILKHERLCVLAPRDHGKTAFFDFAYPLWKAETMKKGIGFIFSATQEQAVRILGDIKVEIETNPRLFHLLPDRSEGKSWSANHIKLTNGHEIYARGFGTKVRGAHPNWIVVDDGLNDETAYSDTVRKKQIDYFYNAISNMVVPGGQLIVVGTPFASGDLYDNLANNHRYHFAKYQAFVGGDEDRPLWSARYSKKRLLEKREEIGAIRFTREFLCCRTGTHVETKTGAVPIEKICVGDLVLTHTGNWRPVTKIMERDYIGDLVRVKGELHVTPNHPVLTADGWVEASDLIPNDEVTFPKSVLPFVPISKISLVKGTNVPFLRTKKGGRVYARGSAKHLKSGSTGKSGSKSIPEVIELDEDLMYLFGLWLAEGCTSMGGRLLTFNFGRHEENTLAVEAARILEAKFGVSTRIRVNEGLGSCYVSANNRILGDFLKRTFKHTAPKKRIPIWMRSLPVSLIWSLCVGYMDGDGHVQAGSTARFSSVSSYLLRDIRFLLARCGLFSVLRCVHFGGPRIIRDKPCMVKPSWVLSLSGGSFTSMEARRLRGRTFLWSRLHTTIQTLPYQGKVYNLEVKKDHSYVADGITVHNCDPISDDMSLFPLYLFQGEPIEQPTLTLGMPKAFWEKLGVSIFIGVDFAMSSSVQADYTVVWTMGTDKYGNRWIIDIQREKGMAYQSQLSLINRIGKKYDPGLIFLESNQMQRIFGDELIRTTDLPIKQFVTGIQKNSLDKGVPSLRVLLENKKFRIPRGDAHSVAMTDLWIEEMRAFTWNDGKLQSVGTHDDTVLGSWICDQAIRAGSFSFAFGEDLDEKQSLDEMIADMVREPEEEMTEEQVDLSDVPEEKASGNLMDEEDVVGALAIGGAPTADKIRGDWF